MKSTLFALLVMVVAFDGVHCICNITALSNVDAITLNKEGVAEKHYGVNFNLMDGYRVIYVTRANVTELCEGIVKFFHKLEELNLIGANITTIEKNAFQHVPKLAKLSLAVNNLTAFKSGYVNEVKSLKVLYLTSNQLEEVDHDSFDNMVNLQRIYLNRNKLKTIDPGWFKNCTNLELIDLSHNHIVTVPARSFANILPSFQDHFVQYRLSFNQITSVNPEAVDANKEFLILRLDSNRLTNLPVEVFRNLMQINSLVLNSNQIACLDMQILDDLKTTTLSLHLVNNPIECDCMDKFDEFISDNAVQGSFYYNSSFNCQLIKQYPIFR